jgi:hypothetical protein
MKISETNRRRFLRTVGSNSVVFPFLLNAGLFSGCVKRSSSPGAMVRQHTYILKIGLAIMIEEEALYYRDAGKMAVWDEVVGSIDLNFVYNRKREKEAVVCAAIESVRKVWEN